MEPRSAACVIKCARRRGAFRCRVNDSRRMRRNIHLFAALGSLLIAATCPAPIEDEDFLTIDFSNEKDAQQKAKWSISDGGKITQNGLGCDKNVCSDWWIETKHLPIGLSWRPASGATITVKIAPPPVITSKTADGKIFSSPDGEVFARYSPDCKHWSTWQALPRDEKETGAGVFHGELGVPRRE